MRIFIWLLGCALVSAVNAAEMRFNFSDFPLGETPTNYQSLLVGGGRPTQWKILMDAVPSAFSPLTGRAENNASRPVVAQTSMDGSDERFPLLLLSGEIFRNFTFTTRFKMVDGLTEQMAGVVFRFQNASNFYVARASALGKNVRFYKVVNGIRSNPIGPNVNLGAGEWHTLAVKCEGNQISISLDDQPIIPTLGDNSFTEGRIGLLTKSDAVSYFADARVDFTPRIAAAQAMVNAVLEKQSRLLGLRVYVAETNSPATHIIASKDPSEIGLPGTEAEEKAIADGAVFFGREKGAVLVTLPFQDRNGEYIGAVRVKMKSYLGETENAAVTRATIIRRVMQNYCSSAEELRK
jgi:Fe-S cluster assembly iron-binding protein IscA